MLKACTILLSTPLGVRQIRLGIKYDLGLLTHDNAHTEALCAILNKIIRRCEGLKSIEITGPCILASGKEVKESLQKLLSRPIVCVRELTLHKGFDLMRNFKGHFIFVSLI